MIETEVQKLVIDAVRTAGGAAHKLSHRFNVGVADLLVKLNDEYKPSGLRGHDSTRYFPAMLLEAKLDKIKNVADKPNHPIVPDVTVPQHSFLTAYAKAGMVCGVMSFIEDRRGRRGLWLQIVDVPWFKVGTALRLGDYTPCGGHQDRDANIVRMLKEFATK